jgi:hypothetical protein
MSLFKKMRDELARRAAKKTVESAKASAKGVAKKIELALFGDGPEEEEKRAAAEAEAKRKVDAEEGGELGRYAARKREEELAKARARDKTDREVESELEAMRKKLKKDP